MVSFDDGRSFVAKSKFMKSHGLGGFAMWLASGDHNDILVNAIRKALF
jgi:chitinase